MKSPWLRWKVEALKRGCFLTLLRFVVLTLGLGIAGLHAQIAPDDTITARSVSGQFVVTSVPQFSPLFNRREVINNPDFVRLDPAVLAVSAERFKTSLREQLGLKANAPWTGKIFLTLHPARSLNDDATIIISPIIGLRDYRVDLPDVLWRARYARALTAVLLLEIANRNVPAGVHSAEIPAWLADGLAQTVIHDDFGENILSAPQSAANSLPQSSLNKKQRGTHVLTAARSVLQHNFTLTFEQLSWPNDAQINGDDGGVYLASTQLFVHEMLGLKNGSGKMRALLAQLPNYLNWQTAFFAVYHDDFPRALDLEKWWALRIVAFASYNANSQWTLAGSRAQLADLLAVPVDFRKTPDALPTHAKISWQAAIQSLSSAQCDAVLAAKLSDIEFAQFRFAPPFAGLVAGYRTALTDFLGNRKKIAPAARVPAQWANRRQTVAPVVPVAMTANLNRFKNPALGYDNPVAQENAALAQYLAALKKNPQLGIVNRSSTATANAVPESSPRILTVNKHQVVAMSRRVSVKDTLKKLDALDLQRRNLETQLNLDPAPQNVVSTTP